jgi:hypothetical protein
MSSRNFLLLFTLLVQYLTLPLQSFGAEEVSLFRSEIHIRENRKIEIVETLRVKVEGEQVKQGIIRALPMHITFPDSAAQKLRYKVTKVKRDRVETKYDTIKQDGSLLVRVFERGVFLEHREHTFEIHYTVSGYKFEGEMFDTFAWHVTGSGWPMPINLAEAFVTFPPLLLPQNVAASGFTSRGDNDVITRIRGNRMHFTTLDPLIDGNGFSISATWAKGFFKNNTLLSVPDGPFNSSQQSTPHKGKLLSVPQEGHKFQASQIDPDLFIPESIQRYFVDIRVQTDGSLEVSESITANFGSSFSPQGLLRRRPLGLDSITPTVAFGSSEQLSVSKKNGQFFLVSPAPLPSGTHRFTFQFSTIPVIKVGKKFDTLTLQVGTPSLKIPIAQIGARLYPPEYMLPNVDLISASILDSRGRTIAEPAIVENEHDMVVSSAEGLTAGGKMNLTFKIPKGFIKLK